MPVTIPVQDDVRLLCLVLSWRLRVFGEIK